MDYTWDYGVNQATAVTVDLTTPQVTRPTDYGATCQFTGSAPISCNSAFT